MKEFSIINFLGSISTFRKKFFLHIANRERVHQLVIFESFLIELDFDFA